MRESAGVEAAQRRTCLSYWYPKLERTGIPTPKTTILAYEGDYYDFLGNTTDQAVQRRMTDLYERIRVAARVYGSPFFLRTGYGSGKHSWKDTCFVTDGKRIPWHVAALAEWSATVDMIGLPVDIWAVREWLPGASLFRAFHGTPISPELRFFIQDGEIVSHLFYWPQEAITRADRSDWRERLAMMQEISHANFLAAAPLVKIAAQAFQGDGAWSLDMMLTGHGWVAIDMAVAALSWGCPDELKPAAVRAQEAEEAAIPAPDVEAMLQEKRP